METETKRKRIWDASIVILAIVHLVLIANIFILHKKIDILRQNVEGKKSYNTKNAANALVSKKSNAEKEIRVKKIPQKELIKRIQKRKKVAIKKTKQSEIYKEIASAFHHPNKHRKILIKYQELEKLYPKDPDIHLALGRLYMKRQITYQKSLAHFNKVLNLTDESYTQRHMVKLWVRGIKKALNK